MARYWPTAATCGAHEEVPTAVPAAEVRAYLASDEAVRSATRATRVLIRGLEAARECLTVRWRQGGAWPLSRYTAQNPTIPLPDEPSDAGMMSTAACETHEDDTSAHR
jgi:hypothetical protein